MNGEVERALLCSLWLPSVHFLCVFVVKTILLCFTSDFHGASQSPQLHAA